MTEPILDGWDSLESMMDDFHEPMRSLDGLEVLWAEYECGPFGCDSSCFVLMLRISDGQLLCVDGGHCSCNGLEGQWSPGPTSVKAELMHRRSERNSKYRKLLISLLPN